MFLQRTTLQQNVVYNMQRTYGLAIFSTQQSHWRSLNFEIPGNLLYSWGNDISNSAVTRVKVAML